MIVNVLLTNLVKYFTERIICLVDPISELLHIKLVHFLLLSRAQGRSMRECWHFLNKGAHSWCRGGARNALVVVAVAATSNSQRINTCPSPLWCFPRKPTPESPSTSLLFYQLYIVCSFFIKSYPFRQWSDWLLYERSDKWWRTLTYWIPTQKRSNNGIWKLLRVITWWTSSSTHKPQRLSRPWGKLLNNKALSLQARQ